MTREEIEAANTLFEEKRKQNQNSILDFVKDAVQSNNIERLEEISFALLDYSDEYAECVPLLMEYMQDKWDKEENASTK